jgi:hypothetical protein
MSPPRADPSREWKKSKVKTEDLLALLNSGFIREKEVDMWRAAAGDPYPMEKAEDEIRIPAAAAPERDRDPEGREGQGERAVRSRCRR